MITFHPIISFSHIIDDPKYSADMRLIRPKHAVQWVASGNFVDTLSLRPVQPWSACNQDAISVEEAGQIATLEMAEALVANAIRSGALQCAYVLPDAPDNDNPLSAQMSRYRLAVVRLDDIEGLTVALEREEAGDEIAVFVGSERDGEDYDETPLPYGLWFLWDEVAALRPDYAKEPGTTAPSVPAASAIQPAGEARQRGRAGRRAKPHAKLLSIVMKRAVAHGLEEALQLGDKALGGWLVDAHRELGISPAPSLEDGGREARAVLEALADIMGTPSTSAQ